MRMVARLALVGERRVRQARDWILQGPITAANGMAISLASVLHGLRA